MKSQAPKDWTDLKAASPEESHALWNLLDGYAQDRSPVSGDDVEHAWHKLESQLPAVSPKQQSVWQKTWVQAMMAACVIGLGLFLVNVLSHSGAQSELYTNAGAQPRTFVLEDASEVALSSGSRMEVLIEAGQRTVVLDGEATFSVKPDANAPFQVKTPELELVVIGTKFTVVSGEPASVEVQEGHVRLRGTNEADWVDAYAGDRFVIESRQVLPKGATSGTSNIATIAVKEQLLFNKTPLAQALGLLSTAHEVKISCRDKICACPLTADFRDANLEDALKALSLLFDAKVEKNGSEIEFSGGRCE